MGILFNNHVGNINLESKYPLIMRGNNNNGVREGDFTLLSIAVGTLDHEGIASLQRHRDTLEEVFDLHREVSHVRVRTLTRSVDDLFGKGDRWLVDRAMGLNDEGHEVDARLSLRASLIILGVLRSAS